MHCVHIVKIASPCATSRNATVSAPSLSSAKTADQIKRFATRSAARKYHCTFLRNTSIRNTVSRQYRPADAWRLKLFTSLLLKVFSLVEEYHFEAFPIRFPRIWRMYTSSRSINCLHIFKCFVFKIGAQRLLGNQIHGNL